MPARDPDCIDTLAFFVSTCMLRPMSGHKCATWLLLAMLVGMLCLRTTVVGYCLCTERLLLASACCCEIQDETANANQCCSVDPAHSPCEDSPEVAACGAACDTIDQCPGDLYFSFEHDDFVPPTQRGLDFASPEDATDDLATAPLFGQVLAPNHPLILRDPPPQQSLNSPFPPSRPRLQSWLI